MKIENIEKLNTLVCNEFSLPPVLSPSVTGLVVSYCLIQFFNIVAHEVAAVGFVFNASISFPIDHIIIAGLFLSLLIVLL